MVVDLMNQESFSDSVDYTRQLTYPTLSSSPGLGFLVVCDTENPKASGNSAVSFLKRVDLPEPEGPHSTSGRGPRGWSPVPPLLPDADMAAKKA